MLNVFLYRLPLGTCIARSSNARAKKPVPQKPLRLSLAKPKKKVAPDANLKTLMRAPKSLGTVVIAKSPFFTAQPQPSLDSLTLS